MGRKKIERVKKKKWGDVLAVGKGAVVIPVHGIALNVRDAEMAALPGRGVNGTDDARV